MSVLTHVIHGIKLGSRCLGGIDSQSLSTNTNMSSEINSGRPYPIKVYNMGGSPQASWSTNQIGLWLTETGLKETCIAVKNLTFYLQKVKGCGARDSSGHISYEATNGLLIPESLSWQVNGNAKLNYQAHLALPEGGISVYTVTNGATLPSIVDEDVFGLKSLSFVSGETSVSLEGCTGVNINFGVKIHEEKKDGDYFPTALWVQEYAPTATIDGLNATWLGGGMDGSAGTLTVVFGQRSEAASFKADADITLTMDGVLNLTSPFNGSGNETATTSATLTATYDGTNHPVRMAD